MGNILFKVNFNRYDEDIISVISSKTRYFSDPTKTNKLIGEWKAQSVRNDATVEVIEVE